MASRGALLEGHHEQIRAWLDDEGLTVVKVHELLARKGVAVPNRTLERYSAEVCGLRQAEQRPCASPTANPASNYKSTSAAWVCMSDSDTDGAGSVTRLIFTPCCRATASCG